MARSPRFGIIPVAAPLHDRDLLAHMVGGFETAFEKLGGRLVGADDILQPVPVLLFIVTGGTEKHVLHLWERRRRERGDEPVFLVAHPAHNSLAAAMEAMARIRREGASGTILYLEGPDDEEGLAGIERQVNALLVRDALERSLILAVGEPSDWLVASSHAPDVIRRTWGPRLLTVGIDGLMERSRAAAADEVGREAQRLRRDAEATGEPTDADLQASARLYLALRDLCREHQAAAVTVRCFDLVRDMRATGCYALARLNDEGIPAACEGDRASTLAMLWLRLLLGESAWMANPSRIDSRANRILLAHCTVPIGMARGYVLRSHFESGIGVGIRGHLPNMPVTLLRIGGAELECLWCGEGEIVGEHASEALCRTQAKIALSSGHVGELLREPLGNHVILVPGHRRRDILASHAIIRAAFSRNSRQHTGTAHTSVDVSSRSRANPGFSTS